MLVGPRVSGRVGCVGTWGGENKSRVNVVGSGIGGTGPIVLFSREVGGHSLVISAASNFMAASQASVAGTLSFGIMSSVLEIPANYSMDFIVSAGTPELALSSFTIGGVSAGSGTRLRVRPKRTTKPLTV